MKNDDELRQDFKNWLLVSGEDVMTAGAKYRAWKAAYEFYGGKIKQQKNAVVKNPKYSIINKEENSNESN